MSKQHPESQFSACVARTCTVHVKNFGKFQKNWQWPCWTPVGTGPDFFSGKHQIWCLGPQTGAPYQFYLLADPGGRPIHRLPAAMRNNALFLSVSHAKFPKWRNKSDFLINMRNLGTFLIKFLITFSFSHEKRMRNKGMLGRPSTHTNLTSQPKRDATCEKN